MAGDALNEKGFTEAQLTEDQIVRYSRQILLRPVGGVGQRRLLGTSVAVTGAGGAQMTALAYLAAGGSPCGLPSRPCEPAEVGFYLTAADVAASADVAVTVRAALLDANPDAIERRERAEAGRLGELPASYAGPGPWVAIGWRDGHVEVVYRGGTGCADCFEAHASVLESGSAGPLAVLAGAIGALCFQRLVLGLSPDDLGGVCLDATGNLTPISMTRCEAHRERTPGRA